MHSNLNISIIVAMAIGGVIGSDNDIPWRLSNDLKRFARLTTGHTVIVGRKTHEAIIKRLGSPLPNRHTIVVTRQKDYKVPDGCEIAVSIEDALAKSPDNQEIFIIGGAEIYRLALPYANTIYLTEVHVRIQGDTQFPPINDTWQRMSFEPHKADSQNEHDYTFVTLKRQKEQRKESFVNLKNARYDDQRQIMEKIEKEEFCPLCPEHYEKSQLMPIIKQGDYWHIRENRWPYKNTRLHFLIIHNKHAEKLSDIIPEAAKELFELLQWIEKEYQVQGGSIGLRFGDIKINGATVNHLHMHIISADITDRENPDYKPVRFRMG